MPRRWRSPRIAAVEKGETASCRRTGTKTYFEWMRNIQPWCISRQLWWGHQIPAWYGPDGAIFVAMSEAEASLQKARAHYAHDGPFGGGETAKVRGSGSRLRKGLSRHRDQSGEIQADARRGRARHLVLLGAVAVLDARLAGRDAGAEALLPTDVLVTGFDIIFFWVARMMMMGLHFMKESAVPHVYIHALVRDEKGQKMSKSKGNVIDPLELIDEYGADALRFTLPPWRRRAATSSSRSRASRAIATFAPSCGTPRASPR
jgi:valyl-tRNA synthetase